MKNIDLFSREWLDCRRAAFDRETERLKVEALALFLAAVSTSCAIGALARLFA